MTDLNLSPAHHEAQAALYLAAADAAASDVHMNTTVRREGLAIRVQMAQAHAALALSLRVGEMQGPSALRVVRPAFRG